MAAKLQKLADHSLGMEIVTAVGFPGAKARKTL